MKKIPRTYSLVHNKLFSPNTSAQEIYEDFIKEISCESTLWLDLGCGHQLFRSWRISEEKRLLHNRKHFLGLDYDFDSLLEHRTTKKLIRGDMVNLPLKSNSLDLVTSNMVVEHLQNPNESFKEINRVLKNNGLFIFHTPNAYSFETALARLIPGKIKGKLIKGLEGREEKDVFKTYYYVNTKKQIKEISRNSGFIIKDFILVFETVAKFKVVPVIGVIEVLLRKILSLNIFVWFRTNIICTLKKDDSSQS